MQSVTQQPTGFQKLDVPTGVTKVVEPNEIESHTNNGWKVIGVFQTQVVEYVADEKQIELTRNQFGGPGYSHTGRDSYMTVAGAKPVVLLVTRYLLWQDSSGALAQHAHALQQLRDKEAAAQKLAAEASYKLKEQEKLLAEAAKAASASATTNTRLAEDVRMARVREAEHKAEKLAAEKQIKKVRAAIGERELTKILGSVFDFETGD